MFFSFDRPEKDRVATRFMGKVHAALVRAAVRRKQETGLTQRALSDRLGWDKGSLSRLLSGRGNPTIRTLGELAWALDVEPVIEFRDRRAGANEPGAATAASPPPSLLPGEPRVAATTSSPSLLKWTVEQGHAA